MSREQIIKIAMVICTVVVVLAILANVSGIFNGHPFGYANAEKYTAGETEITETIKNLEINWINGKVELAYHKGAAVELKEMSNRSIGEDLRMRWWLDGDTLRIQYAKNGINLGLNQEKALTVTLPEGIAFDRVSIGATSGELIIPALKAETLILGTTSGDIRAVAEAREITSTATSGSMDLRILGEAASVSAGTTSGGIRMEAAKTNAIKATSTSGTILVQAEQARECEAGATSGNVTLKIDETERTEIGCTSGDIDVTLSRFDSLKAGSTSGRVTATLPENPGFTAEIETVSGKIDYSLPLTRQNDRYICGDGSGKVKIGTTSGNIQLK